MKILHPYLTALAVLCVAATSSAQEYSVGGGFSAPGYGLRAWGMGGAATATVNDESATYWNPAMLAVLDRNRVGFSYIDLVPGSDAQQSYAAYAHIIQRGQANEPGLEYARHTAGVLYGNLRLELSDGQHYEENTVRLAYAFSPQYFLTVAAAFNLLLSSSDVNRFDSKGTAIDIAVRLAVSRRVTIGGVLRNLASELHFEDSVNIELPRSYTLGLAYRPLTPLTLEGDLIAAFGGVSVLTLGGEYTMLSGIVRLRGGISARTAGENRSVPHVGIGVEWQRVRIEYNANFDAEKAFEDTHRFGLGLAL